MIHIVTKENRHVYEDQIEAMYKLRYDVAVTQWGWDIPNIEEGYDKDQFDVSDTIYLLAYNDDNVLVGCGRLNPTTRPHLLSEIFPDQCEFDGVPISDGILEFSRFIVDGRTQTHSQQVQINLQICLAATEYCVAQGIDQMSWLAYESMYTKSVVLWKTKPLGAPKYYTDDEATYIAAVIDTTRKAIKRIRRFSRFKGEIIQNKSSLPAACAKSLQDLHTSL